MPTSGPPSPSVWREIFASLNPRWWILTWRADRLLLRKGKEAEAKDLYERAIALNPWSGANLGHRGYARMCLGDTDGAIADYTAASRLDPHVLNHLLNRAAAQITKGRYPEAIADATRVIGQAKDLIFASAGYLNRGNALKKMGRVDEAIADFTAAIAANPRTVIAFSNRGSAYLEKEDYVSALADTTEAILRDPTYPKAYHNRSIARRMTKDYEGATADATAAIRLDPDGALAYASRGQIAQEQGRHAEAIADFTEAIRLDPDSFAAYNNRGNSRRALGEMELALADLDHALRLEQGNTPTALLNRGIVHRNSGRIELAIADYTEAIRLDLAKGQPRPVTAAKALYNRAIVHRGAGNPELAVADYLEAVRLDPGNFSACNNLAWLYATHPVAALRDGAKAVELAQTACQLTAWENAGLVDTLAVAHAEAGNFEAACRFERQFLGFELTPERRAGGEARLAQFGRGEAFREA